MTTGTRARGAAALLAAALAGGCAASDRAGGPSPASSAPADPTPSATIACTAMGCSSGVTVDLRQLPATPGAQATVCIDGACGTADPLDGAWWSPAMVPTGGAEVTLTPGLRTTACVESRCSLFEAFETNVGGVPTCASREQVTNEAGDTILVCRDVVPPSPQPRLALRPVESGGPGASATVRVRVEAAGATVFEVELTAPYSAVRPNGERCEPTCWQLNVRYDGPSGRLTAD